MIKLRDTQRGGSDAGGIIGIVILLAVLGWTAAVLISPHAKMSHDEVLSHRDAMSQILSELGLHRANVQTILIPKFDSSLDILINRAAFESVPYPDRTEFAAAVSDIWCSQVSSFLLPVVEFRDIQTGSTMLTKHCDFQSLPEVSGNYSGTVHNNTANMNALFELQLVKSDDGVRGCMQVELPLVGTGPVNGTLSDRNLVLDLTSSNLRIRFIGTRIGHSIKGQYTVTTNGQTGTFTLHQDVPRLEIGFDFNNCPR